MACLVLINGAPGSGKSTLARLLAQDEPLTMAVDIDAVKHSLGQWRTALPASGIAARRLAIAMASEHLRQGHDVLVAQFLARTHFIVELETLAGELGATWVEVVLSVNEEELRARLAERARRPQLPEQVVNNELVSPDDAGQLVRSIEAIITRRPSATVIDASGTVEETAEALRRRLSSGSTGSCGHSRGDQPPLVAAAPDADIMNTLRLNIAETDDLGPELRPSVDGHDLLADYRNDQGVDPDRVLPPLSAALLPTQAGHSVLIGVCSCGHRGFGITVRRIADDVLWEPISGSGLETLKRTYRFGLRRYLDEIDRCAEDRPGEGRGRRVARQVVLLLRGLDDHDDSPNSLCRRRIDWVSAWPWSSSETVKVSLTDDTGKQQILEFGSRPKETEARFAARIAAELDHGGHGLDD